MLIRIDMIAARWKGNEHRNAPIVQGEWRNLFEYSLGIVEREPEQVRFQIDANNN